jgi:ABC-type multidrug transport system permease subunit
MSNEAETASPRRYSPMGQLVLARVREFYREPEVVFWVYGFPILIVVALGIAFRNKPVDRIPVDVQVAAGGGHTEAVEILKKNKRFAVEEHDSAECLQRLRTAKTDLIVVPDAEGDKRYRYVFDPTRPEGRMARSAVDDELLRAKIGDGRTDALPVVDEERTEVGSRYIDFLVPGLLGMNLMGGGLWGVGFATVDMRIRKVLKRFLATPMRKTTFLGSVLVSRLLFLVPEMALVIVFSWLAFGVVIQGSLLTLSGLILLGALTFAGLGLLVGSRAKTLESISGLMNLVMLPMWVLSGIFFPSQRFPDSAQPFIKALPLTALNDALRGVMLENASLTALWKEISILAAWAIGSFVLALRWFRWN